MHVTEITLTMPDPSPILATRRDNSVRRNTTKGYIMQSKAKSNSVITHTVNVDEQIITFHVVGCEPLVFDVKKVSDAVGERAMLHGFIQRVSDAAALSRNPETGLPATPEDKREAMARLVEWYESGTEEWARRREAGAGPDTGITLQAIMDVFKTDAAGARGMIASLAERRGITPNEARAVFAGSREVAARIAQLKADRAAKSGVDAQGLLDELQG